MNEVWREVTQHVESVIGREAFQIWFERLRMGRVATGQVELLVPDRYVLGWVRENYEPELTKAFHAALGRPVRVDFRVADFSQVPAAAAPEPEPAPAPPSPVSPPGGRVIALAQDKTFDTFVVGACNQFAHAAAEAVADFPGAANYNPLFVYGCTGLGKTHLMQAVGNGIRSGHDAKIIYTTAETFVNDMINAIRLRRMDDFRAYYRDQGSVLLIDDVQFFMGKDRSQEEFFHTFQAFHTTGRQIVLTSDVLPRELQKLEPRLRTRFEGGLLADIQPPDHETMMAILRRKSDESGLVVPEDLAEWIASRVRGNIRELEGVLHQLSAKASFYAEPLSLDFARQHLGNLLAEPVEQITPERIMEAVSRFFNIKVSDLKGRRRVKSVARPRQLAMYLAREHTPLSFPDLGLAFGGRDHTTVLHAHRKVSEEVQHNPDTRHVLRTLEQNLGL